MAAGQQWLFAPAQPLVERLGKEFFRKVPAEPGVYSMRDATGNVVYVGKAKNLRQRLGSYRACAGRTSMDAWVFRKSIILMIEVLT